MYNRIQFRTRKRPLNVAIAFCAASILGASAQTTNWVAFNDHAPSAITHPNATGYNMRGVAATTAAGSVLTGNLVDFATGSSVPVVFTSSAMGTPDDFGSSQYPNAGTDAYNLFNGILDLGNNNSMIGVRASSGSKSIVTLSGLDPAKSYVFKGTAIRGNNYTRRWTLVTLDGADAFSDDHSAVGVYTAGNYAAAGMTANQAAFWSGDNRNEGALVGWKEIRPGADGTITLISEQWATPTLPNGETPDLGNYGYGLNSMMLAEVETGPALAPSITVQPVNVTTNEGAVARLSVSASGSGTLSYQWYRDGTAIAAPAGTSSSIVITNMDGTSTRTWSVPSDGGQYYAVVTGTVAPPATSQVAQVTINADAIAPRFLWAVATNNPLGGIVIHVKLSEAVSVIDSEQLAWEVNVASGPGTPLTIPDVNATINGTDVYLEYSGAELDDTTSYRVDYLGAPIQDTAETPNTMTATSVPLFSHEAELIALNHTWKYSDLDQAAPAGWTDRTFDDSDTAFWKSGPGVFDGKRAAELPWCRTEALHNLGPVGTCLVLSNDNAAGATPTMYFRTHFNVTTDPLATLLQLNGKFDDAAVVYLNGVEIWRVGVPLGNHAHSTFVGGLRSVGDGDAQDGALISSSALRSGDNVLAVELRQVNATSSDITMGLRLVTLSAAPGAGGGETTLAVSRNANGEVTITWNGEGTLQSATQLGPNATWTDIPTATSPFTFVPSGNEGYFRVRQ